MNVLDTVRDKAHQKRQQIKLQSVPDSVEFKIIGIIDDLLQDRCCFLKMDIDISIRILMFLGYSKDDAGGMYAKLVHNAWVGEYTIVEPSGIIVKSDELYGGD